ncbi:MAG: adenosine kinase [Bacteroidales bacterium]|nr:adenosine kinase [Bacteroidales bacterium]
MTKVLGMGNALVDIITRIEDDKMLDIFGLPKGSMTLVDLDTSNFIHAETAGMSKSRASGGSAANTIHGLSHLGVETGFVGTVGNDDMGKFFKKDMEVNKIKPILFRTMNETGRAMALISKDSERTFATYLGAAVDLSADDIAQEIFKEYDYFYIEGYLVQDRMLFEKALRLAANSGLKICLDLASYNIVDENVDFFKSMISTYVDLLFANEEEIRALTGLSPEKGAMEVREICDLVVIKLGAEGSFCVCKEGMVRIGVRPSKAIDTTGAGDLYSAGFIYGYMKGLPAETCGQMGAILAGRVIELIGAKMNESNWENLRREIHALEA